VLINLTGEVTADGFNTDTLSSIENAIGSRFDDDVYGNDVDNVLDGGSGGSDQIFGGGGADTVSLAFAVRAQLINLTGQVTTDGIETDTLSSIENAIGSRFADDIFGSWRTCSTAAPAVPIGFSAAAVRTRRRMQPRSRRC
jgi:Ca2+-binding RTX toxin-like protein